jgi:hypothetical protein
MSGGFIFWKQELRVAGPGSTAEALARLRSLLSADRFDLKDRLTGAIEESRVRVWRKAPLAGAGDAVEFEGSLRPGGEGTVIEGSLQYKLATKIQFAGLLAIGLGLLVVGVFQKLAGTPSGGGLLGGGGFIALVTLLWIYSSNRMKHEQIQFIEARLNEVVA